MLTLLTGCDLLNPRICTLMGAWSGVAFSSIAAAFPDDSVYQVRACAHDECVEWEGARGDPRHLAVALPTCRRRLRSRRR